MKLAKAIEILQEEYREMGLLTHPDKKMAHHIALEAMKWAELSRITAKDSTPALLHGETQ